MRGFFSLFLQVVYGIAFAKKHGLPHYVDFSNVTYAYSGPEKGSFWEHFFKQVPIKSTEIMLLNQQYEVYPLRIWDRKHLRFLHKVMKEGLKFKSSLKAEINKIRRSIGKKKVLGIHIRKTDHFMEVAPVDESVFFHKIRKKFSSYDKIFVATDDREVLEKLKKEFSPKIIAHDFIRSHGEIPIHNNEAYKDGPRLAKEALIDCISLSFCEELILSPSNLSYAAMVFNPELKYTIVESKEARLSRLKTLMSYHLDNLGLRKW
jgi:hypothetical protein